VQKVLQNLLHEKVSIRNMNTILEVLVDTGKTIKDPGQLTELVRQRLSPIICNPLKNKDGHLYVLTLDPAIEQSLASSVSGMGESAKNFYVEPKLAEQVLSRLMGQVEKMMGANHMPVLLCAPEIRRSLRHFTERVMPHLSILSMSEVPNTVNLKSFGTVTV